MTILSGKEAALFWLKTRRRRETALFVNYVVLFVLGAVLLSLVFSTFYAGRRSHEERKHADMYSQSQNIYRKQIHRR